jgi:hypothetical protein
MTLGSNPSSPAIYLLEVLLLKELNKEQLEIIRNGSAQEVFYMVFSYINLCEQERHASHIPKTRGIYRMQTEGLQSEISSE